MPTPIETLIDQSATISHFASNSRYAGLPLAVLEGTDGRQIAYVTRRFVPATESDPFDPVHVVTKGERPDHLASKHLGDPERYWELCDLNLVRYPQELTDEPGAVVRLPGGGAGQTTGFFPI
ncbi:MAG TPA: hypothetical protein VFI76_06290 [Terrimicrobiaceae bacterium]|nr:hypothetical protein [Terrimicrobiaceae bacterium]